jgi:hypothetical protein
MWLHDTEAGRNPLSSPLRSHQMKLPVPAHSAFRSDFIRRFIAKLDHRGQYRAFQSGLGRYEYLAMNSSTELLISIGIACLTLSIGQSHQAIRSNAAICCGVNLSFRNRAGTPLTIA